MKPLGLMSSRSWKGPPERLYKVRCGSYPAFFRCFGTVAALSSEPLASVFPRAPYTRSRQRALRPVRNGLRTRGFAHRCFLRYRLRVLCEAAFQGRANFIVGSTVGGGMWLKRRVENYLGDDVVMLYCEHLKPGERLEAPPRRCSCQ
jgi:hypothetical protein